MATNPDNRQTNILKRVAADAADALVVVRAERLRRTDPDRYRRLLKQFEYMLPDDPNPVVEINPE